MQEHYESLMRAIQAVTVENRASRSSALESALVELRHRAANQIVTRSGGDFEPSGAAGGTLFAGITGLPEIGPGQLSTAAIAEGVLGHGALLVRGFFDRATVDKLLDSLRESQAVAGQESEVSEPEYGCSPASLCALIDAYQDNGFLECVRDYFGEPALLHAERLKLRRRIRGRDNYATVPWHQDVNFFGHKSQALNVWCALNPVGEDAPGLAILPRRNEERLGWSGEGLAPLDYGNSFEPALLEELSADHPIAYPVLAPGDALVFDEMTLHATANRPWRLSEQLVAISWFFRASHFPAKGTPIAA